MMTERFSINALIISPLRVFSGTQRLGNKMPLSPSSKYTPKSTILSTFNKLYAPIFIINKKLIDGNWITTGSWEGGVNGAIPGIIMLSNPEKHIGQIYPQEYLKDSAEDKAKVISVNSTTSIQLGTFSNCVVTEETTPLDPGVIENKYYAKGIGNISTILNVGGAEHEELIKIVHN